MNAFQTYSWAKRLAQILFYRLNGRRPWSRGYLDYRRKYILQVIHQQELASRFATSQPLPYRYGARLDERVVEYPWVLTRLSRQPARLLDAGSALNHDYIIDTIAMQKKTVVICNLIQEKRIPRDRVSYTSGDLRHTPFHAAAFDEIVCISTLEHVGLDSSRIYTSDSRYKEARPADYRKVMGELRRLLLPGGHLLLTVPFGRYQNNGWFQQFDQSLLEDAVNVFDGQVREQTFYRYTSEGWNVAQASDCQECQYFDSNTTRRFDSDFAAAARAVACLDLVA